MNYLGKDVELKVVGTRPIRPDGVEKVIGRAAFGADFRVAGMIHGKVLRSPHAHARIKSIDTSKAEALKGVRAVITANDLPNIPSEEAFVRRKRFIKSKKFRNNPECFRLKYLEKKYRFN